MTFISQLLIILAPTYLIRFSLYGMPVNVYLLILLGFLFGFAAWVLYTKRVKEFWSFSWVTDAKMLVIAASVFLLACTISLFVSGFSVDKLGWYLVVGLLPIKTFFALLFLHRTYTDSKFIESYSILYLFLLFCGLLAIIQYHTLWLLDPAYWGNSQEPKRATSLWEQANMFSLFIGPLLVFLLPHLWSKILTLSQMNSRVADKEVEFTSTGLAAYSLRRSENFWGISFLVCWGVGLVGLFYSQSRGAWVALVVALGVFALLTLSKRQLIAAAFLGLVGFGVFWSTEFRYRLITPFHGEQSAGERPKLWNIGLKMAEENYILGKGLKGFGAVFDEYKAKLGYADLKHYNSPHNIFLNFWIDTGLLGLLSFLFVIGFVMWQGIKNKQNTVRLGLMLVIVVMIIHGLLDTPYLKNDLAAQFWILLALF
ncbi:MAG TPA: O-antigen ligase family protein [Patescibacteria group bacterium]|nr:O-antigen ligase family protein [Patescibacteria group bacterium]